MFKKIIPVVFLAFIFCNSNAQKSSYQPTRAEMDASVLRVERLNNLLSEVTTNNQIRPNWHKDGKSFWYLRNLPNKNWEYIYVDAVNGTRKTAFNVDKLAKALEQTTGKKSEINTLKSARLYFVDQNILKLKFDEKYYLVNLSNYNVTNTSDSTIFRYNARKGLQYNDSRWRNAQNGTQSPDGKSEIKITGGNIFVVDLSTKTETALTNDGTLAKPYGNFEWSPDGKNIIAYKVDPKETAKVYYVLSSVPGTTRGQLKSREYDQSGDELTTYEPYILNLANKTALKVNSEKIDFFEPRALHWRNNSNRYFTYEKVDRGHQRFRVIEVDVENGKTRNVIDEQTKTFIYESRIYTHYLQKTNEIIYASEQDGWRHLYLVDAISGKQKLITKGNWVVRDIDSVDVVKRQIWFTASGINKDEDPYFKHNYRINFDGKSLISLTPEVGNHELSFSPDRKYFIDTYSQVNAAPVIKLKLTANGKTIQELEQGDLSEFAKTGVKLPEVFVAKGRDGVTDIWGVVCVPSNMDPNIKYPIIENIYAGPHDSFVPKSFLPRSEMQQIAELGFIVVQIDGMGTANRSKAFHDVCWKNIADAGFPDRILWMKAMALKFPNADINKVGIYGTSAGGQNSTGALLFHPEFYKVAVSSCGCHDNRIDKRWWNEQWMGYPVGKEYEQQSNITNASKLQGNLFLIVGEADENVPPESTYRLADALIKANKDFDILSIPGMGHSDGGVYGLRRKRDFFVKHLLNLDPPNTNKKVAIE
ncbi:S9 family peptidase [Pedobacter changchengzhani]|uniref:S9 family peptidase n=1 Tax=Pedobacter changchengzhani TaxID=2529274 RepID=A0A4R5MH49_9SPHI|nr:S9 family peptidase [Pedobacter changchengzhani]TDG34834.1 S9 family peptidase [Pedobacter changchengzhani]